MEDRYSVFGYGGYRPRYYLRHPFEWVADKFRELKWAKQRAIRGYADCDVWNMDVWFGYVVADMLDQLGDTANGWPDRDFKSFEDWKAWLHKTAAAIRMTREDQQDKINPYWEPYKNELDNWQYNEKGHTPSDNFENYYHEAERIAAEKQEEFETAMNSFSKNFHGLWD